MTTLNKIAPALQSLNANLTAAAKAFASLVPDHPTPEPKPSPYFLEFDYHGIKMLAVVSDGKVQFWRRA